MDEPIFAVATTPTITLEFPDTIDLTEAAHLHFTIVQGAVHILKSDDGITIVDAHTVDVYMPQEETVRFRAGTVSLQLDWTYADGQRAHSDIAKCEVADNLEKKVLE